MGWKKGPLPPGTYDWGGVVLKGQDPKDGFEFADFHGDHVELQDGKHVPAEDVLLYDNDLKMPPEC